MKETGLDYSTRKSKKFMSGVLGGNVNFAACEREMLWRVEKCNEESGI